MIEYLAADPQREYQLTELARLVNLDAATCYPMLTEADDGWAGWSRIAPQDLPAGAATHRRRHLGAGVLQIAAYARPEMPRLSADTGVPVCLFLPSSEDLVIADMAYPDGSDTGHLPLQAGDHIEFGPPARRGAGGVGGPYHVDTWLRRVDAGSR